MMRKLLVSAAAAALFASPAVAASSLVVTFNGPQTPIPGNNDYQANLTGAPNNLSGFVTTGLTGITLTGPARITFEFMGSESFFSDRFTFTADTVFGLNTLQETSQVATPWGPLLIGIGQYNGGDLDLLNNLFFTTTGVGGVNANPGQDGFSVFLPANAVSGDAYQTLFIGYDDQMSTRTPPDDNHDDFIVRLTVSAVPEPATWAMMIGGFGLVGAAVRRRSSAQRTVTA